MRPNRSSNARLSSSAVLQQAWLCSNRKDSRLSGRSPRNHDDKTFDQTEGADVINHGSLPWGKQVRPLCRSRTKSVILSFGASEKVKLNAPDYGEEDTIMGPAGTSIVERFRRKALAARPQAQKFSE